MAALQSIRNRGKLIAICVGAALLAFILGDFLNSSYSIFGASQFDMATINGETISYQDFQQKVEQRETFIKLVTGQNSLSGDMSDQIRDYVWEEIVRENVIGVNTKKLGITTSDDEIINMIQTGNVTPTIRQLFANPQTGMYDPSIVMSFLNDQSADRRAANQYVWDYLENELRESRTTSKYLNMIASGLRVTTSEVEQEFAERTEISDVKFVSFPYSDIKDEEVTVSESDINQYYNQHIKQYDRNADTRDVAYVAFDIVASDKDSADSRNIINNLKDDFTTTSNVVSFINSKSDEQYIDLNYNKGEITNETVDSLMFASEPGFVYGPYIDNGYYKMARLINTVEMPDSVKVAHILCGYRQGEDTTVARHKADSLLTVIKSGIDFGALAVEVSDDNGSAADSGNLGWITDRINFIKEFKDAAFATEKGKITTVATNYGVHIIKVLDKTASKKKVNVGFLQIEIKPSPTTRQQIYAQANKFAANTREVSKFDDAVKAENLTRRIAPNLSADTRMVPGLENSREFVRWAFDEDKSKEVSEVMEFGSRYVVAAVVGVHPKGIAPLSAIKPSIEAEVLAQKKGEKIVADLQSKNLTNVDALAAQVNRPVQEATNVSLSSVQMGGNYDPAIVAVAASLDKNQVSKPVIGRSAVYVIQNTNKTPAQPIQQINIDTDRNVMQNDILSRASYQAYEAMLKMAKVDDKRIKFF